MLNKKAESRNYAGKWIVRKVMVFRSNSNLLLATIGIILISAFIIWKKYPIMHISTSNECRIKYDGLKGYSRVDSYDPNDKGPKMKKVTSRWIYNPSVVHTTDDLYFFSARLSWQYSTECLTIKDRKLKRYCILANRDVWRDDSIVGTFNPKTCRAQLDDSIFTVIKNWDGGYTWFDTKLITTRSLSYQGRHNKYSSNFETGLWVTSQKSEMIGADKWIVMEGNQQILYQMLFVTYFDPAISSGRSLTRAVYYDNNPTHWTFPQTIRYLSQGQAVPVFDLVRFSCENRPSHLPRYPLSTIDIWRADNASTSDAANVTTHRTLTHEMTVGSSNAASERYEYYNTLLQSESNLYVNE